MESAGGELYYLPLGIYETNMQDTTYFPERWGTAINFYAGSDYGCFLFITTLGQMYCRHYAYHQRKWYTDWLAYALKSSLAPLNALHYETSAEGDAIALESRNPDGTRYRLALTERGKVSLYKYSGGKWEFVKTIDSV